MSSEPVEKYKGELFVRVLLVKHMNSFDKSFTWMHAVLIYLEIDELTHFDKVKTFTN